MKQAATLLFALALTNMALGQSNSLQEGNKCFATGDYACAVEKYKEAIKSADDRQRKIAGDNLSQAEKCFELSRMALVAFNSKNYIQAKEYYQSVLDSNPNDAYAKDQIEKCKIILTPPATILTLSKETLNFPSSGGSERISVNTNSSSYSVSLLPSWCTIQKFSDYFVINCMSSVSNTIRTDYFAVTAGNKTLRVYISQAGNEYANNALSVSDHNITFTSDGGRRVIDVTTNAKNYKISQLPNWCKIELKSASWFTLDCSKNNNSEFRTDWFKVIADGKEVIIYVSQLGNTMADLHNESSRSPKRKNSHIKKVTGCFNCPKTNDTWGITAGYIQKTSNYINSYEWVGTDGIQLGVRAEPLLKYGFGINTGLNFEGYFTDEDAQKYVANIPLHLEYRFNFSKWFNIFVFGGAGLNFGTNSRFSEIMTYSTSEFGAGMRINHIQFNVSRSKVLTGALNNTFQKSFYSVSYMF